MTSCSQSKAREALERRSFFKLICGASYYNFPVIEQLSYIFTLAGAHAIDVAPSPTAVWRVRQGIAGASRQWEYPEPFTPPIIMISIGSGHDPHFQTLGYDVRQCEICPGCLVTCPFAVEFNAAQPGPTQLENCIGCGHCLPLCHNGTLSLQPISRTLDDYRHALAQCRTAGAQALEIHTSGDWQEIQLYWSLAQEFAPWDLLAFSLTVPPQEAPQLAERIVALAGPHIILQLDGCPISGRSGQESTRPVLELTRVVADRNLPAYLQASGGTNDWTGRLAREMNIPLHGIGMGSFARTALQARDEVVQIERARALVASVGPD